MSVSKSSELDEKLVDAWKKYREGDSRAVDDVYDSVFPFCLRICSRICREYINDSDEEASIARLAMMEAFDNYNPERGKFLVYLGQVIKSRIIDYKRSQKKRRAIPLSLLSRELTDGNLEINDRLIDDIIDDLARKQEIETFKSILGKFKISFGDLANSSPRQQRSRQKAKEIAWLLAGDMELSRFLIEKNMLPGKLLQHKYRVDKKYLEKYRKFIISVAIIIIYDLFYLKPYVWPDGRGDKNGW